MKRVLIICCITAFVAPARAQEVVTYPVPRELYYVLHNDDYTVKVRPVGGRWVDLYEYNVKVDMDTGSDATLVQFDFTGKVEVRVRKNNGAARSVVVRPLSKGIVPGLDGNTVTFTLDRPENLSVEFDGDRLHNLHVLAGTPEADAPAAGEPGVIYFGPGVHQPEGRGKAFRVPSNSTVYLAGGAFLKGRLALDSVENVRVTGRGMIFQAENGLAIHYSRNVLVEGIIVFNPRYNSLTAGQSTGVTIRDLKSFSHQGWGDGLDFFCCRDVLVERVFLRNSDDCVAIYGHRWDFHGDTRGVSVRNSTLWADIAHPVNIGTHGDTRGEGETLSDISFRDIDFLEHDEDDPEYQGALCVNAGDHNLVDGVTFENIRVESIQEGQLFHLRVMYNEKYNTGPGRGIRNVTFRDVSYAGSGENPSVITGYDNRRTVEGILFERVTINGRKLTSLDGFDKGDFTGKITFK